MLQNVYAKSPAAIKAKQSMNYTDASVTTSP